MRVLFLGNSLVYFNDMPNMFEALARSAGKDIYVDSVTKGAATMSQFADRATELGALAYAKLTGGRWDRVIIEPSRRISPHEDTVLEAEIAAARTLYNLAKAAGALVLIYSVWGNNNGLLNVYRAISASATQKLYTAPTERREHTAFMRRVAEKVSEAVGGTEIIDAGYAFENLITSNPEINLYDKDNRHPSHVGSYLVACTIFSTIFGERCEGVDYTAGIISAGILQKCADDTVINKLIPKLTGDF